MKKYERPEVIISILSSEDIITLSGLPNLQESTNIGKINGSKLGLNS